MARIKNNGFKIDVSSIPAEGLFLAEEFDPEALELEGDMFGVRDRLSVKAEVYRITNAVTVRLELAGIIFGTCSRCLREFSAEFRKKADLNYQARPGKEIIDLGSQIREEIILDYPIKPLCNPSCKGLCARCGKNLNEGGCSCGTT